MLQLIAHRRRRTARVDRKVRRAPVRQRIAIHAICLRTGTALRLKEDIESTFRLQMPEACSLAGNTDRPQMTDTDRFDLFGHYLEMTEALLQKVPGPFGWPQEAEMQHDGRHTEDEQQEQARAPVVAA